MKENKVPMANSDTFTNFLSLAIHRRCPRLVYESIYWHVLQVWEACRE